MWRVGGRTARNAEPVDPAIRTTHKCQRMVEWGVLPGPDPRRALWPAVMRTALTGRTHGRTDQALQREDSPCQLGAVHTWHCERRGGWVDWSPVLTRSSGWRCRSFATRILRKGFELLSWTGTSGRTGSPG